MKKGFTLIELVVAIAILAMMSGFAGVIFNVSVGSHRTAAANAEIMQKLRAITDQLDRDFEGFRKDGEIFVAWSAVPADGDYDYDGDGYVRFDRIMFFASGDFQSYGTAPAVRGNIARISYMLAMSRGNPPEPAPQQERQQRILARTQHILTADDDPLLNDFSYPSTLEEPELDEWHNLYEYDRISLNQWKCIPWETDKMIALSVISGVDVFGSGMERGAVVDPCNPNSVHMLLCEGVGEFKVQGWYDPGQRWVPEVDPYGDESYTDFFADPSRLPGLLYPLRDGQDPNYGFVILGGEFYCDLATDEGRQKFAELQSRLNQERFDEIPGLGRALKFTFTLYDSRGIIPEGRTFTHIVYLGD